MFQLSVSCFGQLAFLKESVAGNEDYDAVPVVGRIGLAGAAFRIDAETMCVDAVGLCENIVDGFRTTLGQGLIVLACAGVFVGITFNHHVDVGIILQILGGVVDVDHLLVGNLRGIDCEADSRHHGSCSRLGAFSGFHFRAGEL